MSQKQAPYTTLTCPIHNEPLEKTEITQGDKVLGWLYVCPFGEWGSRKKEECNYFLDTDEKGEPIVETEYTLPSLYFFAGLEFGKDPISKVIENWTAERTAMQELHKRNNAQAAYIKSWDKLLVLSIRIATLVNDEAGLFSPKLRELIEQFDKQQAEMTEDLKEALRL